MTAEEADQEEFERWYLASRNALIAAAFLYVGKMEDALDLTQETYAHAWQHWDVVSRHANRDAWNRLVLHNLAVSRWRRLAVERALAPSRTEAYEPPDAHDLDLRGSSRGCLPTNAELSCCTSCSTSLSTTLPGR